MRHDLQQTQWDDRVWDQLIESIHRERVIPILGPALSTVEVDGATLSLDGFLTRRLIENLGISGGDDFGLGDVVTHLSGRRRLDDIYGMVHEIMAEVNTAPPQALQQLAAIGRFKLFVTTSFDTMIEDAIDTVRFGGDKKTKSLAYVPTDLVDCDVSSDLRRLRDPIVYHLLGKTSVFPEYVLTDEDLIEYICALQSGKRPERLFDALRDNSLLLLGGTFSDWMVRLFLRIARGDRLSNSRGALEILADDQTRTSPSLIGFLNNFSLRTRIFHADAPTFIDELSRRWTAKFGAPTASTSSYGGQVFVSYAREDEAAARVLQNALKAQGIDVWFDAAELRGGIGYDDLIQRVIKECAAFMPLLSRNTESQTRDAYFRREWRFAEERDTRMAAGVQFILPVVIDDMSRNDFRSVPRTFMDKHMLKAPGGAPAQDLFASVRSALGLGA